MSTYGPWAVAKYSKKKFGLGRAGIHGGGAFFLLECVNDECDSPAAEADARLIAAAPDLLAFAKVLDEFWSDDEYKSPDSERSKKMLSPETIALWKRCRSVIAKAEGRA